MIIVKCDKCDIPNSLVIKLAINYKTLLEYFLFKLKKLQYKWKLQKIRKTKKGLKFIVGRRVKKINIIDLWNHGTTKIRIFKKKLQRKEVYKVLKKITI